MLTSLKQYGLKKTGLTEIGGASSVSITPLILALRLAKLAPEHWLTLTFAVGMMITTMMITQSGSTRNYSG